MTDEKRYALLLLLTWACVISFCTAQTGVCNVRTSAQRRSVAYRRGSYAVQYGCGFWGWSRCSRTLYTSNSQAVYSRVYMLQRRCCSGYRAYGSSCRAICSPYCVNGGRCVSPNTCSCTNGWTGSICSQDINESSNSQLNNCNRIPYSKCSNTQGSYQCSCIFGRSTSRPCRTPSNPSPPTNVRVTSLRSTSTTISWNTPNMEPKNDVNSFEIVLNEQTFDLPSVKVSVDSSRLSYSFTNLQEFDGYQFEIKSVSVFGFKSSSASISFMTLEAAPTAPPNNLLFRGKNSTQISVTWTPLPLIEVNGNLDHYAVEAVEVPTGQTLNQIEYSTQSLMVSLHPFYEYKIRVAAFTNARGPFTKYISVTTSEIVPSGPPRNILTSTTPTSLSLSWIPPFLWQQNGIIRYYDVHVIEHETGVTFEPQSNGISITIDGLHPFYTYQFCISAVTIGAGPCSEMSSIKLPQAAPASSPLNLNGSTIDSTTITIWWDPPLPEARNGLITKYVVSLLERESGSMKESSTHNQNITIEALHPDYHYECRVSAFTVGRGPYSVPIIMHTLIAAPSSSPSYITVENIGPRSAFITWEPPPPESRNGEIISYLVNITAMEMDNGFHLSLTSTSLRKNSLKPFTTYQIQIAALTSAGMGPFSSSLQFKTYEDVPSQPIDPMAAKVSGEPFHLNISWQVPLEPNGIIVHYTIYCEEFSDNGSTSSSELLRDRKRSITVSGESRSAQFPGLRPYTVYNCYVSGNTSLGEGNLSSVVSARTDESTPDDSPRLTMSSPSSHSIFLSWIEPLIPNGLIISYTLIYNDTDVNSTLEVNLTFYEINTLEPFTHYEISIYASTRVGDGPTFTTIIRTSEASPDAPPKALEATVLSAKGVYLSWIPPEYSELNGLLVYFTVLLNDDQFNVSNMAINVTSTEHTFTKLEEYTRYSFQVSAATVAGLGPFSEYVSFTTFEAAPSAPPQAVHGLFASSSVIRITWRSPPPLDLNGILQYYIVIVTERYTGRMWTFFAVDSTVYIGSLKPYNLYDCTVAARTIDVGPFSDIVTIQTDQEAPSAPPIDLSTSSTSTSINLTWTPPPLEDTNGFIQYYQLKIEELDTVTVFTYTANTTQIAIDGLHPHYFYKCYVAAYTVAIGPYSDSVTIQLQEAGPSGAPLNLFGNSMSSESISISWSPPLVELRNGEIRYYLISSLEAETGKYTNHSSTSNNFTLFTLHPYYHYEIMVAAVTVAPGPLSDTITIQTEQDIPSGPVEILTAFSLFSDEIYISWDPPLHEDQNGLISGYKVMVIEAGDDLVNVLSTGTPHTYISVQALKPYTTYEVQVAPFTIIGDGPYGNVVMVTTNQSAPSAPPTNLTVSDIESKTFTLSWIPPHPDDHNGIIIKYLINVSETLTGSEMMLMSFTTSIMIQSLHPYYNYHCVVSAFTVAEGPYSELLSLKTLEDQPSGYPKNISVKSITSTSAIITWQALAVEERNGDIISYTISLDDARRMYRKNVTTDMTSISLPDLLPFSTYFISIAASTSIGLGPFSKVLRIVTEEDGPTAPPQHLVSEVIDSRNIMFSWMPPEIGSHNGIIRNYSVQVTEIESGKMYQWETPTTFIFVSSLHPDFTYEWSVAAFTVAEGPYSELMNLTTPEDVPSGPPVNVHASEVNSTLFNISWEPPIFEERNGQIIGYDVQILTDSHEHIQTKMTEHTFLKADGLVPHTLYVVFVAARTVIGTGPSSTVVSFQTPEDAPTGHPSNLTGFALNSTHIFFDWDSPPEDRINGIIRQYRINITEDNTGKKFQYTTDPEITEKTVGPLHPFYAYHCTVVAYTVEEGPHTDIFIIMTKEATPSGGPTNFTAVTLDSTSAALSWKPPKLEKQNGILRTYVVSLISPVKNIIVTVSSIKLSVNVTGLRPHTSYICDVVAVTVGMGPPSQSVEIITTEDVPTSPPIDVIVETINSTTFHLFWSQPNNHPNGIIRRYIVKITEIETGTEEFFFSNTTVINISGRHPFYHYSCTVLAETIGQGPFSRPVIIQMPEASPALPPTEVQISSVTSTSIMIIWKKPIQEARNGEIRSYSVQITEDSTGKSFQTKAKSEQQLFQQLLSFNNYTVRVAPYTVALGPFSDPLHISTLPDYPSGTPQSIEVRADSPMSLILTWEPPSMEYRNGLITTYTVQITTKYFNVMKRRTTEMSLRLNGLQPFTTYYCIISASNTVGQGPFSNPVIVSTPEDAPVSSPTNLKISNLTAISCSVSWIPPPVYQWNGVIRHYIVNIDETNTDKNYTLQTTSQQTFTIGDLHPSYTYKLSLQAVTIAAGPYSQVISTTTQEDVPTGPPQNISSVPISPNKLHIQWNLPPIDAQNGYITHYQVRISIQETGNMFELSTRNSTAITAQFLHPFYTYRVTVAASTKVGFGPFSEESLTQMPEDVPTSYPLDLVGYSINSTSMFLGWQIPQHEGRNGKIISYSISVKQISTNKSFPTVETDSDQHLLIASLHPFYQYECRAAANTSIGRGPFSPPIVVTTLEDAPSEPPQDVKVLTANSRSIKISWKFPASENINGIIRYFIVKMKRFDNNEGWVLNSTSQLIVVSDLHPYTTYIMSVAVVTIEMGPYSKHLNVSTLQDVPSGIPHDIEVKAMSPTSLNVSWSPPEPSERNGVITGYEMSVTSHQSEPLIFNITILPGSNFFFNVKGLLEFTEYEVSLAAKTNIGAGPYSNSTTVKTWESFPGPPIGLVVKTYNSTIVLLEWSVPERPNGVICGYQVIYYGFKIGISEPHRESYDKLLMDGPHTLNLNSSKTSIVVDMLQYGLEYDFVVRAKTIVGFGINSTVTVSLQSESEGLSSNDTLAPIMSTLFAILLMILVSVVCFVIAKFVYAKYSGRMKSLLRVKNTNQTEASPETRTTHVADNDDITEEGKEMIDHKTEGQLTFRETSNTEVEHSL